MVVVGVAVVVVVGVVVAVVVGVVVAVGVGVVVVVVVAVAVVVVVAVAVAVAVGVVVVVAVGVSMNTTPQPDAGKVSFSPFNRIAFERWLTVCERAGAESVDGTGWFRGDKEQLRGLEQWCAESTGQRPRVDQQSLFSDPTGDETGHGLKSCEITARAPVGAGK